MKEKIKQQLSDLVGYRDIVLGNYLSALVNYNPMDGSLQAVEKAGLLHDLDKHITNLEMELKRIQAIERMNGTKPEMEVIRG